jgi:hypothetical protein
MTSRLYVHGAEQREALRSRARARLVAARADLRVAHAALEGVDTWLAARVSHTLQRLDAHLRRLTEEDGR